MNILNIYSIAGLFYELYYPNIPLYNCEPLNLSTDNPLYRTNALFWAKLLSRKNIEHLLEKMEKQKYDTISQSDLEKAVLSNKTLFTDMICSAPIKIVNQAITEQEMFSYMEQIEIACKLMSKYLYAPFSLSIQDGFQEPNLSSKALLESISDISKNPYITFLEENVYGLLKNLSPKMIWINGQPKLSSLTIAKYVKQLNPNVFIAVRYHSSEYFSLNKIDELLINNETLFSLIDCIVLDDSKDTCDLVEKVVCEQIGTLANCRNILYINRDNHKILRSMVKQVDYSFEECVNQRMYYEKDVKDFISPHQVINLKLYPNTACYWNKCSFCAINKKYKYIRNREIQSLHQKLDYITDYIAKGTKYFWFEDEAIPPANLELFADAILERGLSFNWQVRARIDSDFSEILAQKLYLSGLREIRFGLESANSRILELMNKFPSEVTLKTVESIVEMCTKNGIHVHFPMIVGFPTESTKERIDTYTFLAMLKNKYKNVSFNINILMLDIASDLFRNFSKYGISSISFPCDPKEYLGNMVNYECISISESDQSIDIKRNEFMRETLYPWMPRTALIKPNIFYRLSETIRNTLVWNCTNDGFLKDNMIYADNYKINDMLSIWKTNNYEYRIYNWCSHRIYSFSLDDFKKFSSITRLNLKEIKISPFYLELLKNGLIIPEESKNGSF